jgi:ribosomal protein L16/L10AE
MKKKKISIRPNQNKKDYKVFAKSFVSGRQMWHGNCCIISCSFALISGRQYETLRRFIVRRLYKRWKRVFKGSYLTHKIFKKSSKSRMGKGIGKFYK